MGLIRKTAIVATGGMARAAIKPNSKKERIANAAEKNLKLQQRLQQEEVALERQEDARKAAKRTQKLIKHGAWWLEPGAFKGVGTSLSRTRYLGGWPGLAPETDFRPRPLSLDADGLHASGFVKKFFTIPWTEVVGLAVRSTDSLSEELAANGAIAPQGDRTPDRSALLVLKSRSGQEGAFLVEKRAPDELQKKLEGLIQRLNAGLERASAQEPPIGDHSPMAATQVFSVADELAKLASLRDAGILTEDEFVAQKAKIIGK